jgi:hypothetical protein
MFINTQYDIYELVATERHERMVKEYWVHPVVPFTISLQP